MVECKDCIHDKVCPIWDYYNDCFEERNANTCKNYLPTTDVVEVKHGKWTIKQDEYGCEYMVCSCCAEWFYDGDNDTVDRTPKYCSECGARMDGGKAE